MQITLVSALALSGAAVFPALASPSAQDCKKATPVAQLASHTDELDIVDTAVAAGDFKTLAAAIGAAGLVETLKGEGPFTVFAPTDAAFAKLPKGTLETLLKPKNKGTLQAILTYHVVAGNVMAKDAVKLDFAGTVNGQRVGIDVDRKSREVRIGGALVTATDIECSNGVIHVIDAVILPNTNDIVATAVEAGSFRTLAAALKAASLVEALQGDGPFTVFAPTDDAFAALPEGTVATLLKPENKERLQAVLTYHVVSGRVYSDQAMKLTEAKTLQGGKLKLRSADKGLWINDAKVVTADIDTANGVIHVIDKVLLPQ